jgi:hypothetical protein
MLANKKILIISPHYPPSNLTAVHRTRLFAQHLPYFGWHPIILTVHENYYEESLDWNLYKLIPKVQHIEKVNAYRITSPRLIGDIGLRSFFQLRKRALQLIKAEKIDFIYIPIPSFYVSLIGPYLFKKTGVKYGIDYIDPWVHNFPGSEYIFSRHWLSSKIAKFLEPIALKNASLITGVSEGYYNPALERNYYRLKHVVTSAIPYGGEETDHSMVKELDLQPYLFKKTSKQQIVYAGAMLPKAYGPLEAIFKSIAINKSSFEQVEFHFIGTGKTANDKKGFNIMHLAEKYGLWQSVVFEYPQRIPYLDVLTHLEAADGVFVLGSTEPHYTPSKIYQAVLSGKPILAVLHEKSTAVQVLRQSNAGYVCSFGGITDLEILSKNWKSNWQSFCVFSTNFRTSEIETKHFSKYSARSVTAILANLLDKI